MEPFIQTQLIHQLNQRGKYWKFPYRGFFSSNLFLESPASLFDIPKIENKISHNSDFICILYVNFQKINTPLEREF
jgi:hypothetical protein